MMILFTNTVTMQIIIIIIFILFYPFECQLLFLLFMYKLCTFFLDSYLLHVTFSFFKLSAIEFSHVFPWHPLFPFPVILVRGTFFTGLLLFILIKSPNHLSCCLCIFFNMVSTFSSCLTTSFLTLSLFVNPFIHRKYFVSAAWILLLMSFVSTQQIGRAHV